MQKVLIINTFAAYEDKVLTGLSKTNTTEAERLVNDYLSDGWKIVKTIPLVLGSDFAIGQHMIVFER